MDGGLSRLTGGGAGGGGGGLLRNRSREWIRHDSSSDNEEDSSSELAAASVGGRGAKVPLITAHVQTINLNGPQQPPPAAAAAASIGGSQLIHAGQMQQQTQQQQHPLLHHHHHQQHPAHLHHHQHHHHEYEEPRNVVDGRKISLDGTRAGLAQQQAVGSMKGNGGGRKGSVGSNGATNGSFSSMEMISARGYPGAPLLSAGGGGAGGGGAERISAATGGAAGQPGDDFQAPPQYPGYGTGSLPRQNGGGGGAGAKSGGGGPSRHRSGHSRHGQAASAGAGGGGGGGGGRSTATRGGRGDAAAASAAVACGELGPAATAGLRRGPSSTSSASDNQSEFTDSSDTAHLHQPTVGEANQHQQQAGAGAQSRRMVAASRDSTLRDSPPDPAPPSVPPRNNYSTADSLRARLAGYIEGAAGDDEDDALAVGGNPLDDDGLDDDPEGYLADVLGHYATPDVTNPEDQLRNSINRRESERVYCQPQNILAHQQHHQQQQQETKLSDKESSGEGSTERSGRTRHHHHQQHHLHHHHQQQQLHQETRTSHQQQHMTAPSAGGGGGGVHHVASVTAGGGASLLQASSVLGNATYSNTIPVYCTTPCAATTAAAAATSTTATTGPMVPVAGGCINPQLIQQTINAAAAAELQAQVAAAAAAAAAAGGRGSGGPGGAAGRPFSALFSSAALESSRIHLQKACGGGGHHCSWRLATLGLLLVCLLLATVAGYLATAGPPGGRSGLLLGGPAGADGANGLIDPSRCIIVGGLSGDDDDDSGGGGGVVTIGGDGSGGAGGGSAYIHHQLRPCIPPNGSQNHHRQPLRTAASDSMAIKGPALPSAGCRLIPHQEERFQPIKLGSDELSHTLAPQESWNVWFNHHEPAFVRFNITTQQGCKLALFARKNNPPTLTVNAFRETISSEPPQVDESQISRAVAAAGGSLAASSGHRYAGAHRHQAQALRQQTGRGPADRHRRTVGSSLEEVELVHYLESGTWYLSIINDDFLETTMALSVAVASDVSTSCPNACSKHGNCERGKCQCHPGYFGSDCSESVCPVLCSGRGRLVQGACRCEPGWKGAECSVPERECEVSDCNGNGRCSSRGVCVCKPGFSGPACENVDCFDPSCAGHGVCSAGLCHCRIGWRGQNCSEPDDRLNRCFPDCSQHGVYDLDAELCVCFDHWTGPDCSRAKCNLECGPFGRCEEGRCRCEPGWTGSRCDQRECDPRCQLHGQCNNGTCLCIQGWMGKHCTIEGCPGSCSNKGSCVKDDTTSSWRCNCQNGWGGKDCGVRQETKCKDEVDNDGDGLMDCADSECCYRPECQDSLLCIHSPEPQDILLRKQPPPVTASFYQKMKFLIEEDSVQSYSHKDEYSERYADQYDIAVVCTSVYINVARL